VRQKILVAVISLTFLCLWVASASAAMVSYTGYYSGLTDVTDRLISVSQFNPSMGTLLSVQFKLDAIMNTRAFATNDGDFYAGWDKTQYDFSLTGAGGYSDVATSKSLDPVRLVGSGNPGDTFKQTTMAHITGQPSWNATGPTLTDTATFVRGALGDFIGTGNLSFFLTTHNQDTLGVGGLQTDGQPSPAPFGNSTDITANVTATYDYTPVPIPGALWLLGSGLMGCAGLRRLFRL